MIQRYEDNISWVPDEQEKKDFLARSQKQRTKHAVAWGAAIIGLLMLVGGIHSLIEKENLRSHLREDQYPPELMDWQHQLKTLNLFDGINFDNVSWLQSNTLQELAMKASPSSNALDGLPTSKTCPALTHLTLVLGNSHVTDLSGLAKLTGLTHLTLDLRDSHVTDLTSLAQLRVLRTLTLTGADYRRRSLQALPHGLTNFAF